MTSTESAGSPAVEPDETAVDEFTEELFEEVLAPGTASGSPPPELVGELEGAYAAALEENATRPILDFFEGLKRIHAEMGFSAGDLGFGRPELVRLARLHAETDEHGVTVGGRLNRALPIVAGAEARISDYLERKDEEAPSGIEIWDTIRENHERIREVLGMSDADWHSWSGQLRNAIDSVETLARVIDLPQGAVEEVRRVTRDYRMRLTPYYAGLIVPGRANDPVLLQSVPTGEMIDNAGIEIPPVAADHSPARLIDQFYPRVVTIKATNMCAMYCTHCLRIAHIGKKDRVYPTEAYREALDYIKENELIRDVLVTGGDAFILPNKILEWLLGELDAIPHVRMKRLGTRIPVTCPVRVDDDLLDILDRSNDKKPLRVVTQINTAQEITPLSKNAFRRISKVASAVLNQAVLLKGVNDTRTRMWKLCETIQEAYVRPYYIFNCSYRNPQFKHLRVPLEVGRDIVESMYGNISGDAIPRFIATAGGKVPLHRSNVARREGSQVTLVKPWSGEEVTYPDADPAEYERADFAFAGRKE
jgi:lysine 2,3-aminomutase